MSLSQNPIYGSFRNEEDRRSSFADFPRDKNIDTEKLAVCGFFYGGKPKINGDICKCFFCGLSLHKWEPEDDPWEEHHKFGQNCLFHLNLQEKVKNSSQLIPANSKIFSPPNPPQNCIPPLEEKYFPPSIPPSQPKAVGYNYSSHPETQPQYNLANINPNANLLLLPHPQSNQHSQQLAPYSPGPSYDETNTATRQSYVTPVVSPYAANSTTAAASTWKPGDRLIPSAKPQKASSTSVVSQTSNQDKLYSSRFPEFHRVQFGHPYSQNPYPMPQQIPSRLDEQLGASSAPQHNIPNPQFVPSLIPIRDNAPTLSIPARQKYLPPQSQTTPPFQISSPFPTQNPRQALNQFHELSRRSSLPHHAQTEPKNQISPMHPQPPSHF